MERAGRRREASEGVTVDAELWVDPESWENVRRRLAELATDLHEAARPPHTPGTIPLGVTITAFPLRERTHEDGSTSGRG
ncbi:hypothetical protein ACWDAZ_27950 [Streptomyces sp. NPDC001215]